jgi:hemoglobin
MENPLFAALGGAPTVRAVVDGFYERVLADETLAGFFADLDMDRQRAHLAAFVGVAIGGPDRYAGRGMREAHAGLPIEDAHFDAVAAHLRATLEAAAVGRPEVATILGAVAAMRPDIVGVDRPRAWPDG